ncbi:MAG TPA: DUF2339 domain-containing protein [Thermoanaerobaculia bacterium]|nr:DUF2339 domain-containing protein [Thermoanaerobaculia bacterium]
MDCITFFALTALICLALPALIIAVSLRTRIDRLESESRRLRAAVDLVSEKIRELRQPVAETEEEEKARDWWEEPIVETPAPEVLETPIASSTEEPPADHAAYAAQEPPSPPIGEPRIIASEPPAGAHVDAPPPTPPPAPPAVSPRGFDLENLVGVKLFSWIAGIALALAAVFFLRYSVEHGWLTPPIRMAFGLLTGAALLVLTELRIAANYRVTANALEGAGIAVLYSTLFASHALWHLLPAPAVFALMVLVTAVAVILSIRRDSVFIALLGLVGGFATPALLASGEDRPISLFGYLLLLNAGLAWVAYRKRWPLLSVLTLIFTTIYQWTWVAKFLSDTKLPIAVAVFVIFPLVVVAGYWISLRGREEGDESIAFETTSALAAALPLVFALFLAAVPAYGARASLLFFFLLLVDGGLALIAASRRGPEALHLLGAITTVVVFAVWSGLSYTPAAWPSLLAWISAFALLYLAAPLIASRFGRSLGASGDRGTVAGAALFFVFPAVIALEPRAAASIPLFAVLFALLAAAGFFAIYYRRGSIHLVSSALSILAIAVWSARHLSADTLLSGLLLYVTLTLFLVAVPFVAKRLDLSLASEAMHQWLLILTLALVFFLTGGEIADLSLLGLGVLLVGINIALFLIARRPSLVALVLSWLLIGAWWLNATITALLVPALVLVIVAVLLAIVLSSLVRAKAEEPAGTSIYLSLIGHFFLLHVAGQAVLSIPPWPMLAVIAVIDLAIGIAALRLARGGPHLAALVMTQLILLVWIMTAAVAPWPSFGILSAQIVCAFALVWMFLARRQERLRSDLEMPVGGSMATAAIAALVLAQLVAIVAAELPGRPSFGLILTAHLAFQLALLGVAWLTTRHAVASLAVVTTTAAVFGWRGARYDAFAWPEEMILATATYLLFLAWPIVQRRTERVARGPYLAAVLASASYFFFAKQSLGWRGYGEVIGFLPVAQAILLLLLLVWLIRRPEVGAGIRGALALVAGAALAFITVAIPLQLEKEWITIGWAILGASLVWLYGRIEHRGLLAWAGGLLAIVAIRLVFNPAVLSYHPRAENPILNWYLYTYAVPAAAFFVTARLLRRREEEDRTTRVMSASAATIGTLLLFLLLNIEIADFYSKGSAIAFDFNAGLAQDLTYTLGWALFAIALLIAGLVNGSRAARIASLALLLVSVLKCFLHDLMRLGGLYRVGSLVGLAISLAIVAVLLQRFVIQRKLPQEEVA